MKTGNHRINLDSYARQTRYTFAGLNFSERPVVLLAVQDLGKSGSDSVDQYGSNPKYKGATTNLCSEFVSWYYYEQAIVIGNYNFRDATNTQDLHSAFKNAGRLYRYDSGKKKFVHSVTGESYLPKAGDYLERRSEPRHSMMMLRWDDSNHVATVINGPWPITLRTVKVQKDEENGKDFWLGKI